MPNAFKYRDYRLMWGGSLISNMGDSMQEVAEDWLVFVMTGSPFLLGLVSFCKAPSRILLGPVFGVLIDRLNRKKTLIAMHLFQLVLTITYGVLITTKLIQFWHIVVLAILGGFVLPIIRITRQTIVPDLVPRESLVSAITLNSVGNHGARVVGPLLGGILIIWLGIDGVFYLNALSYSTIIASVIITAIPERMGEQGKLQMGTEISAGLRFIKDTPVVQRAMVIQFFSFLFFLPFTRLFPVYAKDILRIGPTGLGLLRGSFAGGGVLGGLGMVTFTDIINKERSLILSAIAMTVFLILFSHSSWLSFSLTCLVAIGISSIVFRTIGLSVIQLNVPDQIRGRVMGLYQMEGGFRSVGGLLYGSLASLYGTPITVALGGASFGLLTLFTRYATWSKEREAIKSLATKRGSAGDGTKQ